MYRSGDSKKPPSHGYICHGRVPLPFNADRSSATARRFIAVKPVAITVESSESLLYTSRNKIKVLYGQGLVWLLLAAMAEVPTVVFLWLNLNRKF